MNINFILTIVWTASAFYMRFVCGGEEEMYMYKIYIPFHIFLIQIDEATIVAFNLIYQ